MRRTVGCQTVTRRCSEWKIASLVGRRVFLAVGPGEVSVALWSRVAVVSFWVLTVTVWTLLIVVVSLEGCSSLGGVLSWLVWMSHWSSVMVSS